MKRATYEVNIFINTGFRANKYETLNCGARTMAKTMTSRKVWQKKAA